MMWCGHGKNLGCFEGGQETIDELKNRLNPKDYVTKRSVVKLVDKLNLPSSIINKYPYEISGGEQQRISIIRALINNLLEINNSECIIFDAVTLLDEYSNENVTYSVDACYKSVDKFKELVENKDPEKVIFAVIIGVNALMNKLSAIEKSKFQNLIIQAKSNNNVKILIAENIDVIKTINFEPWYKGNVDLSEGVWIGNGIGNQFTLRVTTNSRLLRAEIEPGFGYCVKKGRAALIKLMVDE